MEESYDSIDLELTELHEQEIQLNAQLTLHCEQLLLEFSRRFPPLKMVPELTLRPNTLTKWLKEHTGGDI